MKKTNVAFPLCLCVALALVPLRASALVTHNDDVYITGWVGIGTSSPQQQLHIYKNYTVTYFRMETDSDQTDFFSAYGNFGFKTDDKVRMSVMKNGNIGIGKYGASTDLHLHKPGSVNAITLRMENDEGRVDLLTDSANMYFKTSSANRMIIKSDGKVGIGTLSPGKLLEVNGEAKVNVLNIAGGADLSEQFNVKSEGEFKAEPGMVVCIDAEHPGELVVSSKGYDRTVAGIISGAGGLRPGMMMGQAGSVAHGDYPVSLSGRVYCMVDATGGAVVPGDLLTTADTPGHAMKVLDYEKAQGAIVGKAMTGLPDGTRGLVLVLVSLQ